MLGKPAHHTVRCRQAIHRTAGKHDGLNFFHEILRPQEIGLSGTRGGTPHVHAGYGSLKADDDGYAA